MPKLSCSVPAYSKHKSSGQAVVRLNYQDIYLGPYGSKESRLEYDRVIAQWVANGRRLAKNHGDLTILELYDSYRIHCEKHYRKNGKPTREISNIKYAMVPLVELHGETRVAEFGPLGLKAVQVKMIESGICRRQINSRIGKIKRMFKWAVSEEKAPRDLFYALSTVAGLEKDRTDARESPPVDPVADSVVDFTLPHLPPIVADMVRFQRYTGCRPGEVCLVRPCDINRTGEVWFYVPSSHKTEHHGQARVICIGPKAQAVITKYLFRDAEAFCFSPIEAETKRKAELRDARKTKVQPSQRNRAKSNPKRTPGKRYTSGSYLWAVHRACVKAFPAPKGLSKDKTQAWRRERQWSPNQLRHSSATEIRNLFGLEAAQCVLGHSRADVTQIYAEKNRALAAKVMGEVG